jgi:hypothetical protein
MFGKYNGFVSKARVSARMYFLVVVIKQYIAKGIMAGFLQHLKLTFPEKIENIYPFYKVMHLIYLTAYVRNLEKIRGENGGKQIFARASIYLLQRKTYRDIAYVQYIIKLQEKTNE